MSSSILPYILFGSEILLVLNPDLKMEYFKENWEKELEVDILDSAKKIVCFSTLNLLQISHDCTSSKSAILKSMVTKDMSARSH